MAKPVDMYIAEHVRIATSEGAETLEKGIILRGCDPDLAVELAAAGKARPATEDELAAALKSKAKPKEEAA